MIWLDRLRTMLATLRYPAAWTLPPRLGRSMRDSLHQLRPMFSPVGIVLHPYAPPIGGRAFGRYLEGLKRMYHGDHVPLVAHVSVTDRCRNSCRRCSNLPRATEDPDICQLNSLIDKLREAGTVSIAITGGEPMLRPDLPEIIAACSPDISTTLFTTGLGFDDAFARRLRGAGLEMAFISLDHFRPELHDSQRGTPGTHKQAVRAIRSCHDAGLYTVAQAVVGDALLVPEQMHRYLEFCHEIGAHETMLLEPVSVWPDHHCASISQPARSTLISLHQESARNDRMPKVSSASFLESPEFLGCQAGYSFIYISAAGDLFPCDFAPISLGNVYREPLGDILARVRKHFVTPSCRCLALDMNQACAPNTHRPLSVETAEFILKDRLNGCRPKSMWRIHEQGKVYHNDPL